MGGKSSNDWVSHKNVFKASVEIEEVKAHLKKCKQLIESEKKARRKSDAKGFNSRNREKRSLDLCVENDKENVDAIDDWLTKNLFTEEPKANAKQNSKMLLRNKLQRIEMIVLTKLRQPCDALKLRKNLRKLLLNVRC